MYQNVTKYRFYCLGAQHCRAIFHTLIGRKTSLPVKMGGSSLVKSCTGFRFCRESMEEEHVLCICCCILCCGIAGFSAA